MGFCFAAVLPFATSAAAASTWEAFQCDDSALAGKYSSREYACPRWSEESVEALSKLWGEARPLSGVPRRDNRGPRSAAGCDALLRQNANALASLCGPHLYDMLAPVSLLANHHLRRSRDLRGWPGWELLTV